MVVRGSLTKATLAAKVKEQAEEIEALKDEVSNLKSGRVAGLEELETAPTE